MTVVNTQQLRDANLGINAHYLVISDKNQSWGEVWQMHKAEASRNGAGLAFSSQLAWLFVFYTSHEAMLSGKHYGGI